MTFNTINAMILPGNISWKVMYFDNVPVLSAVFTANRKYQWTPILFANRSIGPWPLTKEYKAGIYW